tara:strand:- start:487 stop:1692 length:1206 start_codon:yes stop_codon:yes gene_type:complete
MKLTRSAKLALNMLIHSKLRSWLTIIGIVIGVAAVVIIISAGASAQATLESQLTQFGTDYVTINPAGAMGPMSSGPVAGELTDKDIQVIEGVAGVRSVTGMVVKTAETTYAGETKLLQIAAMKPSVWNELMKEEIALGRKLEDTDTKEIVIGDAIAEKAFRRDITLNQVVDINGQSFRVVGLNDFSGLLASMDNFVLMNLETAKNVLFLPGEKVTYQEIDVMVDGDPNEVSDEIERRMLLLRHETSKDKTFIIMTPDDILDQVGEIMTMVTALLGAIAVISLIVGAVGIMNTMFTSALEKTKEIGIMKSIGARNKDIVNIFLLNAGMVGFVGGALGCALGIGVLYLIAYGVATLGITIELIISPMFIAEALLLATGIGMLAGAIPAWRASKLKPVDALRYE